MFSCKLDLLKRRRENFSSSLSLSLFHDQHFVSKEINYDSPRGGVSVITEKSDITTSYLLIQRAKPADSGKYTCRYASSEFSEIWESLDRFNLNTLFLPSVVHRMQMLQVFSFMYSIVSIRFRTRHFHSVSTSHFTWIFMSLFKLLEIF